MCFSTPMLPYVPPTRSTYSVASTMSESVAPVGLDAPPTSCSPAPKKPTSEPPSTSSRRPSVAVKSRSNKLAKQTSKLLSPAEAAKELVLDIDLSMIGKDQARKIMSEQHKILGFRPPPGSLAAEAQAAAARHPVVKGAQLLTVQKLKEAAKTDAEDILLRRDVQRLQGTRRNNSSATRSSENRIQLNTMSEAEALHASFASQVQAATTPLAQDTHGKNPYGHADYDSDVEKTRYTVFFKIVMHHILQGHLLCRTPQATGQRQGPRSGHSRSRPRSRPNSRKSKSKSLKLTPPPLERLETGDSIEIVCNILG
ncbi:unnamed protein product [Somion occarium]|uniref:Uncharacterized protein n=1 Tax=Somion occarium TaxID=3059160 RepID=A0ABP1CUY7_9APHY